MYRYALAALYGVYGVLYILAFAGVLDCYAVVVGCLATHFTGLAFHYALLEFPGQRWVVVGPVYPTWRPLYEMLVILDGMQMAALVLCAVVLAGGAPRGVETEVGSLVIAYMGVVGCLAKLYINAPGGSAGSQ